MMIKKKNTKEENIMDEELIEYVQPRGGITFREANYIKSIVLVPRLIDGVELNANRTDFENERAAEYAAAYEKPLTAGSDNHTAHRQKRIFGMDFYECPKTEKELAELLFAGKYDIKTE